MTEFAFSDIIDWDSLDEAGRTEILRRPAVMAGERISAVVKDILDNVEKNGDAALREYSAKFDRTEVKNFRISKEEVDAAWERVSTSAPRSRGPQGTLKSSTRPRSSNPSSLKRCRACAANR